MSGDHCALILGTLAGQTDAITMLQRWGWEVHACGHETVGPGVEAADGFHLVDIVDPGAVAALAERLDVSMVYSVGSDIAMPTIAAVSEQLGLPHFHDQRTTEILHRKDLLRAFLRRAGISPVEHRQLSDVADVGGFTSYPAILKPVDNQGQRGITIVGSPEEARAAFTRAEDASRSGNVIIEELLDGPEISVHVFVVNGEVRFFLPTDRYVWDGPLVGIPEAHAVPSAFLDATARPAVEELVRLFVSELEVQNGPLYFQLKLTRERGPRIIEVASRLDGCHLWRLIEFHTNFNLMAACFRYLAGDGWTEPGTWDDESEHILRFHLGPPDRPFDRSDHPLPDDERVVFNEFQVSDGELPRDTNGVVARVGYYIVEAER